MGLEFALNLGKARASVSAGTEFVPHSAPVHSGWSEMESYCHVQCTDVLGSFSCTCITIMVCSDDIKGDTWSAVQNV